MFEVGSCDEVVDIFPFSLSLWFLCQSKQRSANEKHTGDVMKTRNLGLSLCISAFLRHCAVVF